MAPPGAMAQSCLPAAGKLVSTRRPASEQIGGGPSKGRLIAGMFSHALASMAASPAAAASPL